MQHDGQNQQPPAQQPMQGQPQQFYGAPGAYYPPPKQGWSGGKIALVVGLIVVGLMLAFGVLVGVLAVAVIPKLSEAKNKLEARNIEHVAQSLQGIAVDDAKKRKLMRKSLRDQKGSELWVTLLSEELIPAETTAMMYSPMSATDTGYQGGANIPSDFAARHCSYTGPAARDMLTAMNQSGANRCVLITWNSRNWNNASAAGVPVIWSDSGKVDWLTFEQASTDYGITEAEWADPAGKLFGKKPPFQHTYE